MTELRNSAKVTPSSLTVHRPLAGAVAAHSPPAGTAERSLRTLVFRAHSGNCCFWAVQDAGLRVETRSSLITAIIQAGPKHLAAREAGAVHRS